MPTTFIFFGASGDLFSRKLAPAFARLVKEGALPPDTRLVGVSRKGWSDDDFRAVVKKAAPDINAANIFFVSGDVNDSTLSDRLSKILAGTRAIFYLALPSMLYADALRTVEATYAQMNVPPERKRVLVEKPFGRDAEEARALDAVVDATVGEQALYRIDHYLQKESVQNILAYRFSNELFAMIGNPRALSAVHVFLLESDTVEGRGAFYDATGALSDVVQNHVLQMLAAVTMRAPSTFAASAMRTARTDLFSRLRLPESGHLRAQYNGYQSTPGVAPDSTTETYVRLQIFIDDPEWKHVPIILEAGKGMPGRSGGVRLSLMQSTGRICFDEQCTHENAFEFLVAPQETTALTVWGKKPGLENILAPQRLSCDIAGDHPVDRAYDRVLYDAWKNDASRFVMREEAQAAWAFTDAARAVLLQTPLHTYPIGTHPDVIS